MTKLYAQRKDVFDINKVTVVGSPTITSDGVASGFSYNNYLNINNPLTNATNYEVLIKFKITDKSTYGYFFAEDTGATNGFSIYNDTNNIYVRVGSNTISNLITKTELEKEYEFRVKIINGSIGVVNYKINGKPQTEKQLTMDGYLPFSGASIYLGTRSNALTTEGFARGSIDLNSFKIYVDGELVYSPTKPVYALERRKPKVWNKGQFTIVGNPSISDSGVATNLNQSGYITVPFIDVKNKAFSYKVRVKFNSLEGSRNVIFGEQGKDNIFPLLCMEQNHLRVYIPVNETGSHAYNIDINAKLDTWYDIELLCNLSNIIVKINGTEVASYPYSGITYDMQSTVLCLGTQLNNTTWKLDGSIDLKSLKIYTNNNLVFDGGAETYVYDSSKFTVVGSPTITEDGVASGFSNGNIVKIPSIDLTGNFKISIKNLRSVASEKNTTLMVLNGTSGYINLFKNTTGMAYQFYDGSHYSDYLRLNDTSKPFDLEFISEGANFTANLIIEDTVISTVSKEISFFSNYVASSNATINLGYGSGLGYAFPSSISLPSTSIIVDGKEVFTGAKEKFYAMRGM